MARKHKASGGQTSGEKDFGAPRDDWKEEESSKPLAYAGKGSNVEKESEEKKKGGRAKRKRGGATTRVSKHHESGEHMKHAKHVGKVKGEQHFPNAGRAPRKSGGRTGSNFSPLSSAHAGTPPRDHKVVEID